MFLSTENIIVRKPMYLIIQMGTPKELPFLSGEQTDRETRMYGYPT